MTITGAVFLDLRDVPADRAHRRLVCLPTTPTGAKVIVVVGPLRVDPHLARLLREHTDRLHLEVWGEAYAVQAWTDALRTGDVLPLRGSA